MTFLISNFNENYYICYSPKILDMKRAEILERIIEEQTKIIANLKDSVERYRIASDIDEDSTLDPEDLSRQAEMKDMQLRFEKMLREANVELAFMKDEEKNSHSEIEKGSLVETDKNFLFVGISVPSFKFYEKDVVSFSEGAPIFQKLKGKKVGDKVEIGPNVLEIKSIS